MKPVLVLDLGAQQADYCRNIPNSFVTAVSLDTDVLIKYKDAVPKARTKFFVPIEAKHTFDIVVSTLTLDEFSLQEANEYLKPTGMLITLLAETPQLALYE